MSEMNGLAGSGSHDSIKFLHNNKVGNSHDNMNSHSPGSSGSPVGDNIEQGFPLLNKTNNSVDTLTEKKKEAELDRDTREGSPEDGRETWGKKVDFLLSIIGFAVDLANVWRFPNLCYRNGGGAFLIPYFTMLIFGAIPLFYMELALGQFHRQGAVGVWKIAPIFKGVGMAECFIAYLVAFYYNVIIAWSVYYLISSFSLELPWTTCGNSWNSDMCCVDYFKHTVDPTSYPNQTGIVINDTYYSDNNFSMFIPSLNNNSSSIFNISANILNSTNVTSSNGTSCISPVAEFFERRMLGLHLSPGIEDVGPPRWQLVLCLMVVFTMLFFSLWKGVKSSGKVVWVTATMPYVILSILLIRGVFLPGAWKGIKYFLIPDFKKILSIKAWSDAAVQVFYSTGAGFGVHLAYASYNKFHNNCYRDCLATASINAFTSIFSGLVIFSYLGYMSVRSGVAIDKVAEEGPGLTFRVYPEALASLPGSHIVSTIMAVIFFFMLITLGLDSAMGGLEAALTGLRDEFPQIRKYKYHREILTLCVCGSAFLFALQNITNGGMYLFVMWDTMAAGVTLLLCVFCQSLAIGWFYGLDQFVADIKKMLGFTPGYYWRFCWKFISPIFLAIIIVVTVVDWSPLEFKSDVHGVYKFPFWGNCLAWMIVFSSMILIPGAAIYKLIVTPGSFRQRIALCISPQWEHSSIKKGGRVKRFELKHWLSLGHEPVTIKGHAL